MRSPPMESASDIYIHVPGSQCTLLCGETSWVLPSTVSSAKQRALDAAGFAASHLAAEALLHMNAGARSACGQGIIATNLYSTQDEVAANTADVYAAAALAQATETTNQPLFSLPAPARSCRPASDLPASPCSGSNRSLYRYGRSGIY